MKNIILFTLFFLGFSYFTHAQVVEKYIDRDNTSTTVIEKVPTTADQDVLSTLNLDDYDLNEQIYIIDHRQEEEIIPVVINQTTRQAKDTATQVKPESPERNPIGEKVKRKRKRTPRWKSDRRGKRSRIACFKF